MEWQLAPTAGTAVDPRTGHRIVPAAGSVTFRKHRCERLYGGVRDAVWGRVGERREHRLACGRGLGGLAVRAVPVVVPDGRPSRAPDGSGWRGWPPGGDDRQ